MWTRMVVTAGAAVLFLSCWAQADLNLQAGNPDIYSTIGGDNGGYVTYPKVDAFGAVPDPFLFWAHAQAQTLVNGSLGSPISAGVFDLTARIDSTGQLITGSGAPGTLSISETINGTNAVLLAGDLEEFDFEWNVQDSQLILEFLFNVTGGSLASMFHGGPIGVIMNVTGVVADAPGNLWSSYFDANTGYCDTFAVVPAPGAAVLAVIGLGLVSARRRQLS